MMIIQTVFYKQPRRVKGELLYAQICMHIIKEIQVIQFLETSFLATGDEIK